MKHIQFTITLTLQAPILTHTSGSIGFGLDAAMQRDQQGRPIFAGSLIRGNLRHAWQDLNDITNQPSQQDIEQWLGKAADSEQQLPHRASLSFSEYWTDEKWTETKTETNKKDKQTSKRYRIAIDETTGAVKTGALQVIESPYAVNETAEFTGTIDAKISTEDKTDEAIYEETNKLQKALEQAFTLIPAIGALKTNGFGKLLKTNITSKEIKSTRDNPLKEALLTTTQLGLRITPQAPFCFAKPAIGENNHFESEEHIPAAAIVAAIANSINEQQKDYPELNEYLSQLHFTHARAVPTSQNNRPLAIPLTLVNCNDQFYDIAHCTEPETFSENVPLFLIDWKTEQFNKAEQLLNPPSKTAIKSTPDIQLKIRTAIEQSTGTAKDNQLFSMETVSPEGFNWLSNISLINIPEAQRATIIQQLHKLLQQPLMQLGKTKASADVQLEKAYSYATKEQPLNSSDKQVIIYLQSAARLLPTGYHTAGTNQGEKLQTAYQQAWQELSQESLKLSHFFAQQKLEGGEHWWKRFRQSQPTKSTTPYHPEIFTQQGSVFVLDIINPEIALPLLAQWQQQGLPQLADAPGGEDWQNNPWIAANGYGEIAINLDITGSIKHD